MPYCCLYRTPEENYYATCPTEARCVEIKGFELLTETPWPVGECVDCEPPPNGRGPEEEEEGIILPEGWEDLLEALDAIGRWWRDQEPEYRPPPGVLDALREAIENIRWWEREGREVLPEPPYPERNR